MRAHSRYGVATPRMLQSYNTCVCGLKVWGPILRLPVPSYIQNALFMYSSQRITGWIGQRIILYLLLKTQIPRYQGFNPRPSNSYATPASSSIHLNLCACVLFNNADNYLDYTASVIDGMNQNGAQVEWYWQGETEVLGDKSVPAPLCPPQIPHALT
jgi:hypothetical protein